MMRTLLLLVLLVSLLPLSAVAEVFDEPEVASTPVPHYDPDGEALRSLILPGWSQFRQGQPNAGFGYATVAAITMIFLSGVVDVPLIGDEGDNFGRVLAGMLYGLNALVPGFDAHPRASESNLVNGRALEKHTPRPDPGFRLSLVRVRF